ncbi:OPT family oligopeptide transporter, partial [Sphingomonas sp. RB1R13]|uniref:OPT family oligopeptide transporter n=1 Tax=Sphingomonas sp. RB1R13 TaxID=3096159 RepID=UPI002FC70B9E
GLFGRGTPPETTQALVAYALIVTGIVFGVATISNDNLQDLKTGELVGATPWKQQVALMIGVVFGSLVIPPVLDLLNATLGFAGTPGAGPNALSAPQAALISALAKGVLGGDLNWTMIGVGALVGVGVIVVDELCGKLGWLRLPPLGVGLGIYLPMSATLPVVVGAVIGHAYDRWAKRSANPEAAERLGVRAVMASGGKIIGRGQALIVPGGAGDWAGRMQAGRLIAQLRYAGPADTLWRLTGVEMFDLSGPVAIGADVTGSLNQPVIRGAVKAVGARIESATTGTVLTDVQATGRFGGSRLVIDRFAAQAGKDGRVSGTGQFDFAAAKGVGLDLALNASNAVMIARDDIGATVTGPLTFHSDGAGGTIGAISGAIGTLTNAGTIDGGSRSAIDAGANYNSAVYSNGWTNTGTITSNGTAATLANLRSSTLTNSGTISNNGTGAAISGNSVSLVNQAGGLVTTTGTTAIQSDNGISLVNSGTIVGDIASASGPFGF